MPDQFSAAASTYGWGTFAALVVLVAAIGIVANWRHIKALAVQAKPVADPIAEALELAKQLDALHVKLGLPVNEREAALADVITRAFKGQA